MIRHAIIDSAQGNLVVNIIDYPADISGQTPPGMQPPLMAQADLAGRVGPGFTFRNGVFTAPPEPPPVVLPPPALPGPPIPIGATGYSFKLGADGLLYLI